MCEVARNLRREGRRPSQPYPVACVRPSAATRLSATRPRTVPTNAVVTSPSRAAHLRGARAVRPFPTRVPATQQSPIPFLLLLLLALLFPSPIRPPPSRTMALLHLARSPPAPSPPSSAWASASYGGSQRRVSARRRGGLSVVAVQTGPQKPSPSSTAAEDESDALQKLLKREYKYGFVSDFESFSIPKGLSEATVRRISELKAEPAWMLDFRLAAYRRFLTMVEPTWSDNDYAPVDLQSICYYSAPKAKPKLNSLDEKRLANVAVDAVIDSTSIATTHREALMAKGVIFCSISEAIREYPDLVKRYLGSVVPPGDNYYAALNSAVFSDGSFCYVPKDTVCPMEISTYFRINDKETGQFERTLIVADDRSTVSYLEGCTAPAYDSNQLHAAVVELVCEEGAEIKYSTVQNWYAGDEQGNGGIYNFVTKRGRCKGRGSKISWTQVETAITLAKRGAPRG
ncbi:hypothetical protein PR202_gb04334 [Eleusine coracana subsp. coracana]|uniref:Uncharacterized protein n=1 Tax=Eleusine coracana subsp. coracana TaxID=191504 RepID=A0AAV5E1V6_ELECO|nr:hypothetical protein PR202_gb04334 [Eleusine coracana subsp. coracana]